MRGGSKIVRELFQQARFFNVDLLHMVQQLFAQGISIPNTDILQHNFMLADRTVKSLCVAGRQYTQTIVMTVGIDNGFPA